MALNIKDKETEALVAEIASLTGDTKTGAVRQAARERLERLKGRAGRRRRSPEELQQWLETEIWSQIPDELLDRPPITKAAEIVAIGAPTLVETGMVTIGAVGERGRGLIAQFLESFEVEVLPFGRSHWEIAEKPLLFIGNDFAQTDIAAA